MIFVTRNVRSRFLILAFGSATFFTYSLVSHLGINGHLVDNGVVVAADAEIFSGADFDDWVTYADHVAIVEVVEEARMEPESGPEVSHVGRMVTIEIQESLWSRQEEPPSELSFITNGWIVKGEEEREVWPSEGLRLAVGARYVIPLFETSNGWGLLNSSSVIPLENDQVHTKFAPSGGAAKASIGNSTADIRRDLASAKPDPLSRKVDRNLDAVGRARAIAEIKSGPAIGRSAWGSVGANDNLADEAQP